MKHFFTLTLHRQPAPHPTSLARVVRFYGFVGWSLLSFFLLIIGNNAAFAQLRLVPVTPPLDYKHSPAASARPAALGLPFFDDFSTATNRPDPALWQSGGGVYINNTLPLNHPSVNVATFDGLNGNGVPYGLGTPLGNQATDTLTSLPINLAGRAARDSIYISFYWQRRGLGELPDEEDSLRLQFLNDRNQWVTVWKGPDSTSTTTFTQTFIPVRDPAFFHAGFQFRFEAFGRASGPFDMWHLDYIYLNQGRSMRDIYIKDIAVRQAVTPYLKRYSAMPLKQYLVNPAAETTDTIRTDIVNLFNNFNFTTLRFSVRDEVSGQVIQNFQEPASQSIGSLSSQPKMVVKPTPLPATFSGERAVLRSKFDILTTDDQNPSIPTINLRRNDTISGVTVLDNYYAYDDGTAEYAIQSGRQYTRFMMRFVLNKPDVVSAIRMYLVPYLTDAANQPFAIAVMSNNQGQPGTVLTQQSVLLQYPAGRNQFVEFPLNARVAVSDTFFVGWTQIQVGNEGFAVGFDKNSSFSNQFLFNEGSGWYGTDRQGIRGVPMIRPVMGGTATEIITGVEDAASQLEVYPNPSTGLVSWNNQFLNQLEVLDLSGRRMLDIRPHAGQQQADLSQLADGFYLLRLSDGKRAVVQKLIIRK
ncbi:T9SS type A sorting domain-containing protein [Tellurirhabdus bombi]|uniref:T9SS type A sorting domain-containing protein n=1 Tax=Tellurirhabdus bombi TaxID=2907205 RepID=UPI001F3979E1|nr:T9SS type A sorting domain-containing protein [Tellurirhabdus bombi]